MGGAVVRVIQQTAGVELIAGIDKPGQPEIGKGRWRNCRCAGHLGIAVSDRIEPYLSPTLLSSISPNPRPP